jgi:hypothetical protein
MAGGRTPGPTGIRTDPTLGDFDELRAFRAHKSRAPGPLGLKAKEGSPDAGDAGGGSSAASAASQVTVPGPLLPKISMPPFKNAGPSVHPALPQSCQAGQRFSAPPTQTTTGFLLSSAEVATRRADIASAVARAKSSRPLAAANLQHWSDSTGSELVMSTATFLDLNSRLSDLLSDTRAEFEKGIKARLADSKHQQGSLLPEGTVRFLQFRDGIRPSITGPGIAPDLAIAVGAYLAHSVIWVKANPPTTSGGFLGIGQTKTWKVDILRWCVQVMDSYDWNFGAKTPIPVDPSQIQNVPLPPAAIKTRTFGPITTVEIQDDYFRDLEVSGGGKSYLVYTEPFDAPKSFQVPFTISI